MSKRLPKLLLLAFIVSSAGIACAAGEAEDEAIPEMPFPKGPPPAAPEKAP